MKIINVTKKKVKPSIKVWMSGHFGSEKKFHQFPLSCNAVSRNLLSKVFRKGNISMNISNERHVRLLYLVFDIVLRNIDHLPTDCLGFNRVKFLKWADLQNLLLYEMRDVSYLRNTHNLFFRSLIWDFNLSEVKYSV